MAFDAQQGANIIDMGFHKIPALNVSSLKYLSGNFKFIVTLNQYTFGFKSVSGLSVTKEVRAIEEGGVNDHGILVSQPDNASRSLVFSRGLMLHFPEAIDKLGLMAATNLPGGPMARFLKLAVLAATNPQESLERGPALGTIIAYDRNGNLRGKYTFISLGVTEWRVSDLDATDSSGLLIEELTVAHTGLTREPVTLMPSSIVSVAGISGSSQAEINAQRAEEKLNYQKNRKKWAEKLGDLEKEKEDKQKELEKVKELTKQLADGELDEAAIEALTDVSDDVKKMLKQSLKEKKIRDQQETDSKAREAIKDKIKNGQLITESDLEGMSEEAKKALGKEIEASDSEKLRALQDADKREELDRYTKNLEEEKSWKAEDAQKSAEEQEAKNSKIRSEQIKENTKENYEKARDERKAEIEKQNAKRAEEVADSEQAKAEKAEKNKELVALAEENKEKNEAKRKKVKEAVEKDQKAVEQYLESTQKDREKAQEKAEELRKKHQDQAKKQAEKDKEVRKNLDKYNDALNEKKDEKAQQQQKLADAQNQQYQKNREESLKND